MRTLSLLILAIASLTGSAIAHACMHPFGSTDSRARIKQSGQQALVLFHEGVEELVLKVDYAFDEDSYEGTAPPSLAWIVPVPSIPSHYSAQEADLFTDLDEWVELEDIRLSRMRTTMSAGGSEGPSVRRSALVLLPTVQVGPYAIQPIRAQGENAGRALNEWMRLNSFAEIPEETMQHYLSRRWTFLAVRASSSDSLGATGSLPPLSIRFATDRPVYPLKFSTHMGTFPVRAYLITADDLPDSAFAAATHHGFVVAGTGRLGQIGHLGDTHHGQRFLRTRVREFGVGDAPPSLRPILGALGLGVQPNLFLRVLRHRNLAGESIAGWNEDLAFPPYANRQEATAPPFAAEDLGPPEPVESAPEASESLAAEPAPAASRPEPAGCACRIAHRRSAPPIGFALLVFTLCWRRRV